MLMIWTDNLSVGVKELDDWSKKLIRIINDLHYAIRDADEGGSVDKEEIEIALHRLENYSRCLCRREETLLSAIGYANLDEQKKEHQRLAEAVAEMNAGYRNSTDPKHAAEIMRFIYDWVTNHIYVLDKKFVEPLRKRSDVFL